MNTLPQDSESTQRAFQACQISAETFAGERGSVLLITTLIKAGAAGINAAAVATAVPKSVRPVATLAQAAGRSAWWLAQGAANLRAPWNLLAALITTLAGLVLGGQADPVLQWIGLPIAAGALVFLLVNVVTLQRHWRGALRAIGVAAAACLLFAAYIPPIREHLFGWLGDLMTGWEQGKAPVWWLVVCAFLILPAVTTPLAGMSRRFKRH
jgi:hypothetical protein